MNTKLTAILEIRGDYRGRHADFLQKALAALNGAIIKGHLITGHHIPNEQPIRVPDFGHDIACRCEDPEPYGVLRYFGLTLWVQETPSPKIYGTYLLGQDAQIAIVGIESPVTGITPHPLQEA